MSAEPTFRECRLAAASIRRAGSWSRVRSVVRPRGVAGLPTGAPLAVRILLAARQGHLVWQAPDALAWVLPPAARPNPPRSRSVRALAALDACWEFRWALLPASLLVGAAGAAAGGARTAAVLLIGLALGAVLTVMLAVAVRGAAVLVAGPGRLVETVVEQLRQQNWTVLLLHAPDPVVAAELLARARRSGDRPHLVLVHRDGVTPPAGPPARGRGITIEPLSARHPLLVVRGPRDGPPVAPDGPGRLRGRDLGLLLSATVLVVLVAAGFVSAREQDVCAPVNGCDGVPATYGDAIYWLVSRLTGGDPDGLGAVDPGNRTVGVLMTIYGVYVLVSIIGIVVRQRIDDDLRSGPEVVAEFTRRSRRPGVRRRR